MIIENHFIKGANTLFASSPNTSGKYAAGLPDTIIIHYTAGADAKSSVRSLCDPASKASAHIVIGRDGSVTQLVPFDTVAWHAGRSSYGGRDGYNQYSIGIEIDNAGILTKTGTSYQSWFGRKYQEEDVIQAIHRNETSPRYWHTFTEQQIALVNEICTLLIHAYGIKTILGHEEISPGRKQDPGPAFPLDKLRDRLLNSTRNEDGPKEEATDAKGIVTANSLNIRIAADTTAKLAAKPLLKGTQVKLLEKSGDWYKVEAPVTGWVSAKYLE